jgi:CMP-2-keto-3-deoxyoctulosonic acid synthetase
MSDPLVLIPARMAATRLPNKPMADLAGEPMIVHVWRRAVESGIGPVVVATDTPAIVEAIEAVGGLAVLTRVDHPSGSDRLAETRRAITTSSSTSRATCRPSIRASSGPPSCRSPTGPSISPPCAR